MSQCSLQIAERPAMLALARRSGCRLLSFGIESTSPTSLQLVEKPWNRPDRYAAAIRTIRTHGIDVSTEMIVGFHGDDDTVFERTLRFIADNEISLPRVHILTPIPGTPLYQELEREGRILHRDFSRYTAGRAVFRPRHLTPEQLEGGFWEMYHHLFTWQGMWERVESDNRSVKISARISNPKGELRSGMYARGAIVIRKEPNALVVPRPALLVESEESTAASLYVVDGSQGRRRQVQIGGVQEDRVWIREGFTPGDLVIVEVGPELKDGSQLRYLSSAPERGR